MQYYDVIGDIHGHADALEALLLRLGYQYKDSVYQHTSNKALFVGDLIDRGPKQRRVIEVVRSMVQHGQAHCVMGNHEFNAICYATTGANGRPLRANNERNRKQHAAFLNAYPRRQERDQIINWFKSLPLFIETEGLRVIHAAWNEPALTHLSAYIDHNNGLLDSAYSHYADRSSNFYHAIETILKGPETRLPEGVSFQDKEGAIRNKARIMWWRQEDLPAQQRLHLGDKLNNGDKLSQLSIANGHYYQQQDKPLFVGHYWLDQDVPALCTNNCACLDYSIAQQGKLVAYKWRGERRLSADNFEWTR